MKFKLTIIFSTLAIHLLAQSAVPDQIRATNVIDRVITEAGIRPTDIIYGIPRPPGETVSSEFYFDKKWNASSLSLYESKNNIVGYYVKYELKNEVVEVMTQSGIRVLDGYKIRGLIWVDSISRELHQFINSREYASPEGKSNALLELLVDGRVGLMRRIQVSVKKPDYVAAIDMGSRDEKWSKQEFFYLVTAMKLLRIKNKQSLLAVMPEQEDNINNFIKANGLRTGRKEDLKKIVTFMNSLDKGN